MNTGTRSADLDRAGVGAPAGTFPPVRDVDLVKVMNPVHCADFLSRRMGRSPIQEGGLPVIGPLGLLPGEDGEEVVLDIRFPDGLELGDAAHDEGPGAGEGDLDLPLPLLDQVRRVDYQGLFETGHPGGGDGHVGLAGPHLADGVGAPVGPEALGEGADGVFLGAEGFPEEFRQRGPSWSGMYWGW